MTMMPKSAICSHPLLVIDDNQPLLDSGLRYFRLSAPRPHVSDVAQTSLIPLKPDMSLLMSASPRFLRGAWDDRIACSDGPSVSIVSSTRYSAIVRQTIPRKDSNTAAVARHFEKCETKGVPLRTKHAADKPLPFLSYPITLPILNDHEIIMCKYGLRREAGHILCQCC